MTSVKTSGIVLSLSTLDLKVQLSTGCSLGKHNGLITTSSHQMNSYIAHKPCSWSEWVVERKSKGESEEEELQRPGDQKYNF